MNVIYIYVVINTVIKCRCVIYVHLIVVCILQMNAYRIETACK